MRLACSLALIAAMSGCGQSDPPAGTERAAIRIVPVRTDVPATGPAVSRTETGAIASPLVQRIDPSAIPASSANELAPASPLPTRKTFVDPPLPPELVDDAGLLPLPDPPGRNTDR